MIKEKLIALFNQGLLIIFTLIFKPFFFLSKKEIWFFCDRPGGIDNAYFLYKYVKNKNKKINCKYLCDNKNDSELKKLSKDKNIVYNKSIKHYWYFIHSKKIIFSFDTYPFYFNSKGIYFKKILKPKTKLIFLQHGIINSIIPSLKKKNTYFDLFVTSSDKEKDFLKKWSGYKKELILTGLPRFDNLYSKKYSKNIILFAPTWNNNLISLSKNEFIKSDYYKNINSVINSREINIILKNNGFYIYYIFHQKIYKFKGLFETKNSNIKIIYNNQKGLDYSSLIKKSKLLITDYSSILFDFAYQKKPIIYYQKNKYHYENNLNIEYENLFGDNCNNEEELINLIKKYIKNNFSISKENNKKIEDFFYKIDKKNSDRVYKKIKELK